MPSKPVTAVIFFFANILVFSSMLLACTNISSVYTGLTESDCKQLRQDQETESSVELCPGVSGYQLQLLEDDLRQSVNVITPDNKIYALNYWHLITSHHSYLGDKAEWRVTESGGKKLPIALIIRVNAQEQTDVEHKIKNVSYLAVAKISAQQICVVSRIPPVKDANQLARTAADNAKDKACLTPDI